VLTWAVGTPVALVGPSLGAYTGVGIRTWSVPIAAILLGAVALGLFARNRLPGWLAGATAGLLSSWVVLSLASLTRGTPFPFFGLLGDSGRLTALATRYSVTAASSDAWIPGRPGEYPPLFPWLVGRASALLDVPAWKLVGRGEILVTGLAVLVGYLMWRRLLPEWSAVAVTLTLFMTSASPPKCYEFFALMMLLPWVLATFGRPPRGRLHWLTAGLLGGVIFLSYYGWLIFGAIGILSIVVIRWRAESDRRGYLLYLAKVIAVTVVVSSWYLIPFLRASFTIGSQSLGDLNGSGGGWEDLFPFLNFTVFGGLALIGLVGLIVLRNQVWWATGLLTLVIGAYVYRLLNIVGFVLTNHTQLSAYAARLSSPILMISGVLVLIHVGPQLTRRLSFAVPRALVAVGLAVVIGWGGLTFTQAWLPVPMATSGAYTIRAYNEPDPDGHYLTAPSVDRTPWFPVGPVQAAVEQVYGPNPRRVSLSVDDRLYAYLPWPGYLATDRIGLFIQWDKRYAELERLAATRNPAAFAAATADTGYGPIDIFILKREGTAWDWSAALGYNGGTGVVQFSRDQFDPARWVIRDDLPEDIVVALRR
jgi:Arabinofuranosyltransferase N terminal